MRTHVSSIALGLLSLLLLCLEARADNAIPVATREADGLRIVLFCHAAPIRAGMVELSLMILDAESGEPMVGWDARGQVKPIALSDGGEAAWVAPCCRVAPKGNVEEAVPVTFSVGRRSARFAAETSLVLPRSGTWALSLEIARLPGPVVRERIDFTVAPPQTPLSQYWFWFAAIPVVVVGYAFTRPPRRKDV
jgi:hypothetical protein